MPHKITALVLAGHHAARSTLKIGNAFGRWPPAFVTISPLADLGLMDPHSASQLGDGFGPRPGKVGSEVHNPKYRSYSYVASSASCYEPAAVAGATLPRMRSTPEKDEALRARLEEAVNKFADGSSDAFARLIGYANGGYIREIINKKKGKVVREALIDRVNNSKECKAMHGWFDDLLRIAEADQADDLAARLRRLPSGPDKEYLVKAVGVLLRDAEAKVVPELGLAHQHRGTPALNVKPPGPSPARDQARPKPGDKARSET